jgi:hypothetical protein
MRAARCRIAANRRLPQRHRDQRILGIREAALTFARPAGAVAGEDHAQIEPGLHDGRGVNVGRQVEIVALEQTPRKLQPARHTGKGVFDRTLLAIDNTILVVDETVRIQH